MLNAKILNVLSFQGENHAPMVPGMGAYPMYNPETGQWLGMYPYPPPFFPTMYPPAAMPYPNNFSEMGPRGGYRGRYPRSRGRRIYRGRVNHYGHDERRNDDWDHKRRRDHRKRYNLNETNRKMIKHPKTFALIFRNPFQIAVTAEAVVDRIHRDPEVDHIQEVDVDVKVSYIQRFMH